MTTGKSKKRFALGYQRSVIRYQEAGKSFETFGLDFAVAVEEAGLKPGTYTELLTTDLAGDTSPARCRTIVLRSYKTFSIFLEALAGPFVAEEAPQGVVS